MLNYLVYKHTAPNGKVYIGQTCQSLERRCRKDGIGYKGSYHFYNAIQKYGWNNFKHEVISTELTKEEADWLEKYLIRYYNSDDPNYGYNLTAGGGGADGWKWSKEAREKMSEITKGHTAWNKGKGLKIYCVETNTTYSSITEAADLLNTTKYNISHCLCGRSKTALGYHWKYLN